MCLGFAEKPLSSCNRFEAIEEVEKRPGILGFPLARGAASLQMRFEMRSIRMAILDELKDGCKGKA